MEESVVSGPLQQQKTRSVSAPGDASQSLVILQAESSLHAARAFRPAALVIEIGAIRLIPKG